MTTKLSWFLLIALLLACAIVHVASADDGGITPSAFQIVEEEDASPSCAGSIIKVSNTTLTDNADGTCSVSTSGGGNSFETIAVPAGASVVADSATDTLTLTETSFLTITGTAATDTIDITQVTTDLGTDGLITANAVDSAELATDSVSADELNATGVEAELESTLDIAGDVSSTGMASTVIGSDKVLESHLKAVDAASDENILTFETTTGDFEWHTCAEITGSAALCDGTDADSGGATAINDLGDAAADGAVALADWAQVWTANTNDVTAIAEDLLTIALTNDAATDILTQQLLVLLNNASANGVETGLLIKNADTDDAMTDGILFDAAAGAITIALNAIDPEIGTALSVAANDIVGTTGLINYTDFDVEADGDVVATDITLEGGDLLTGNIALRVGDATTDTITLTTDGTGTGEVVLPAASIGDAEVVLTQALNLPIYSAKVTGVFVVRTPTSGDASTQGAEINAADGNWRLLFDPTTDEAAVWQFRLPDTWTGHSEVNIQYSMTSATAAEVDFEVDVMCITPGDSADVGASGFVGVATASDTVPGTAGFPDEVSVTVTDDACAAGDLMFLYLSKDANDATLDDATGDTEVIAVEYEYTR